MLLKGKAIFCVEDNALNRVVFQLAIVSHGAAVQFERWGPDALARLQEMRHVDLIIMDLMLAENTSGFDIFDSIKANPQFADIPVVAVSAMDPSVAMGKAREKGFAGFIAKPIDKNLFPKQLAAIIDGEQIWYTGSLA